MPEGQANVDTERLIDTLSTWGPVLSVVLVQASLLVLVYFAAPRRQPMGAERTALAADGAGRLRAAERALGLLAAGAVLGLLCGWISLFGAYLAASFLFIAMLAGLPCASPAPGPISGCAGPFRSPGFPITVFAPFLLMLPPLFLALLGIADHLFDLRGGLRGTRN